MAREANIALLYLVTRVSRVVGSKNRKKHKMRQKPQMSVRCGPRQIYSPHLPPLRHPIEIGEKCPHGIRACQRGQWPYKTAATKAKITIKGFATNKSGFVSFNLYTISLLTSDQETVCASFAFKTNMFEN